MQGQHSTHHLLHCWVMWEPLCAQLQVRALCPIRGPGTVAIFPPRVSPEGGKLKADDLQTFSCCSLCVYLLEKRVDSSSVGFWASFYYLILLSDSCLSDGLSSRPRFHTVSCSFFDWPTAAKSSATFWPRYVNLLLPNTSSKQNDRSFPVSSPRRRRNARSSKPKDLKQKSSWRPQQRSWKRAGMRPSLVADVGRIPFVSLDLHLVKCGGVSD